MLCVCACVRACVRVCVRERECVCVSVSVCPMAVFLLPEIAKSTVVPSSHNCTHKSAV